MKKLFPAALCISMICVSCSKDDVATTPPIGDYLSTSANSTWNYQLVDSVALSTTPYILTSTNRDSTVNGRAYHVFTNSIGPNEYYNLTSKQYFSYEKPPAPIDAAGTRIPYLYLMDEPLGTTWTQSHQVMLNPPIQVVATFDNKIEEKGLTKTINNIVYTNVVHIKTVLSVTGVTPGSFTNDIHAYYAPKVGLIQKDIKIRWDHNTPGGPVTFLLNNHIKLMSSVIL